MKALIAVASLALLAGCASTQCVQPDPVQPASKCWNKGVDCGSGIQAYGEKKSEAVAKPAPARKAAHTVKKHK